MQDFASQIVVELLEAAPTLSSNIGKVQSSYFIRLSYNGEGIRLNGCKGVICPMTKVINLIGNMLPPSTVAWEFECENKINRYNKYNYRLPRLQGYLGIDWEEWPNMATFLAL